MKDEELKRLIERYYNGESNEEEERSLRDFFRRNDVPAGYEAEKSIFGYYAESETIPEPSIGFEARILAGIDASEKQHGTQKNRRYLIPLISAAAGLLLLAGSYFFIINRTEPGDTFSDPAIAYAETVKILRDVSSRMNRGAQALEPVGKINEVTKKGFETISKSTRLVEKNLKSLNLLQKSDNNKLIPADKNTNK
jgi:hypothetical protein